ncbi:MAG: hypothetical protein KKC71_09735 [Chloroflexi bacterium]|nr:hypothetical protein [Chloroflexota bacterium]
MTPPELGAGGRIEARFWDGLYLPSGTAMGEDDLARVMGIIRRIGPK